MVAGWLFAVGACHAAPKSLEVVVAEPIASVSQSFRQQNGWTGADGAYSIPLDARTTLWTFADTFIGRVEQGRRTQARMINNSFAWQTLPPAPQPALRFFWREQKGRPEAVLRPKDEGSWYWPGDGVMIGERLYLQAKRVRKQNEGEPGFQFDWYANDLLEIANPRDEPAAWRWRAIELPDRKNDPQLSSACLVDGDYLYIYGLFPASKLTALHRPLGLARIAVGELLKPQPSGWQFYSEPAAGRRWSSTPDRLAGLFNDAAPEITVSRVPGVAGLVATYTSLGMGSEIRLRCAPRPEGPWSAATLAYRCPEAAQKLLVYAAKAHPELSTRPGELIVTYCVNTGSLAEHMKRPDIYVPRALRLQLKTTE